MTATLDNKKRAVIVPFSPGDVVQIEQQDDDVLLLRRMKPAPDQRPRIVRQRNGDLVSVGGGRMTSEDVKRMLEDDL